VHYFPGRLETPQAEWVFNMTINAMKRTLGILLFLLPAFLSEAQDEDGFVPLTDPDASPAITPEPKEPEEVQAAEMEKRIAALPPQVQKAIRDAEGDIAFIEGFGRKDSGQLIKPLSRLRKSYSRAGMYEEAEKVSRRALNVAKAEYGAEHAFVARFLNNIAIALAQQGHYNESEAMHREGLAMRKKLLGDAEHPAVATALNGLALVLERQGKYAEAEATHREALAMMKKLLGEDHPSVAVFLNGLATTLREQEKYSEADPLFEKSLAICEKKGGAKHPNTAVVLSIWAESYRMQKRYAEAKPLAERAFVVLEKALGSGHPDLADTLETLAGIHKGLGDDAKAADYSKRAEAIRGQKD
jgi:tetratricopeptide (TPR) repeat protein